MRLVRAASAVFAERKPDVIYERYSLYSTAGRTLERLFGLPRILEVNSFLVHEQKARLHFPRIAHRLENSVPLGNLQILPHGPKSPGRDRHYHGRGTVERLRPIGRVPHRHRRTSQFTIPTRQGRSERQSLCIDVVQLDVATS